MVWVGLNQSAEGLTRRTRVPVIRLRTAVSAPAWASSLLAPCGPPTGQPAVPRASSLRDIFL